MMDPVFDQRRYLIPFRTALLPQIFTDVLIIGAGVGGLRAAVEASECGDVIVTHKATLEQSNTYLAQGGIAAVVPHVEINEQAADSFDHHVADTLDAGAGLCDESVVRLTVEQATTGIGELLDWGMRFDRVASTDNGGTIPSTLAHWSGLALGREGAHSRARILHADGDSTGRELVATLHRRVAEHERIRLFDRCVVLDLLTLDENGEGVTSHESTAGSEGRRCLGAITHHPKFGLQVIWASATILASGGCGQIWRESTNPSVATGDGLAMAYRAGAKLADMAFMQFHPTTLYIAGAARSLISEAVRGEGATLIDHEGYRFMPDYDERADLAPRDIVSRSILAQVAKTRYPHVFLDCRSIGSQRFAQRFPGIFRQLQQFGIDPGCQPVPVYPSAHYMIGGVATDTHGRTNLPGLYACGEVAATGLHGANRLASNSLLEGLVFGQRAGRAAAEVLLLNGSPALEAGVGKRSVKMISDIRISDRVQLDVADVRSSLRSLMWRQVGIERSGEQLEDKSHTVAFWAQYTLDKIFDDRAGWELQNMLLVGALIIEAARWRNESRGTHYRLDYPQPRAEYHVHDGWQRGLGRVVTTAVQEQTANTPVDPKRLQSDKPTEM